MSRGDTYAPFRLNIKDTKVTWMGSLPHGWVDQGGARNDGKHDRWLEFKHLHDKEFAHFPLTLGYYEREDLPFFYSFADAFTVCDQNFCSSLTATIPNRLHLWTGTVRAEQNSWARANILNEYLDYDSEVTWKTFPERLEESGVSWCVYQNELSLPSGLEGEADSLLTNFGDNVFEWFTQYRVRFLGSYRNFLRARQTSLSAELMTLETLTNSVSDKHIQEYCLQTRRFGKSPARPRNLERSKFCKTIAIRAEPASESFHDECQPSGLSRIDQPHVS